jgi:hypothetical protein
VKRTNGGHLKDKRYDDEPEQKLGQQMFVHCAKVYQWERQRMRMTQSYLLHRGTNQANRK